MGSKARRAAHARELQLRLAFHGHVVVMRGDPLLWLPNVPMPQAFSPRERYQNPAPIAGTAGSLSDVPARLSKQVSSAPPGPTGNAPRLPRTTSYCVASVSADQL